MNPTYTPLQPGQTPTYGTTGGAVAQLQADLNKKYYGTPGYTPLAVDGKFGPLTQAAYNNSLGPNNLITTSDKARYDASTASSNLNKVLSGYRAYETGYGATPEDKAKAEIPDTYTDANTALFDRLMANSNASTRSMIAEIRAAKQNEKNKSEEDFKSYQLALKGLGVDTNLAASNPTLFQGQFLEARQKHEAKIADIDREERKAVMDAENAQETSDIKTLMEKMNYVEQLRKDKAQAIKDYADSLKNDAKFYMDQADFFGDKVYQAISGLGSAQKQAVLEQLSQQTGIPVQYLAAAAASVAASQRKGSGKSGSGTDSSNYIDIAQLNFDFPDSVIDPKTKEVISSPTLDKINEALANGYTIEEIGSKLNLTEDMINQLKAAITTASSPKSTTTPKSSSTSFKS